MGGSNAEGPSAKRAKTSEPEEEEEDPLVRRREEDDAYNPGIKAGPGAKY